MSIKHKCGRKSKSWMAAMLWTLAFHYKNNTFKRFIDTYIALSNFSKQQFIDAGFDPEKIEVKPNFINFDPGYGIRHDDFVLYVGRLSLEKGIDILLKAWEGIRFIPLKIIGDGEDVERIKDYAHKHKLNVEFLGQMPNSEAVQYMKKSLCIVLPSRCNENFPRTLAEAFACGRPLVASRSGAIAEIVEDGKTGLLFEPENPADLANKVRLLYKDKAISEELGRNARRQYEENYTAEKNYEQLINIYRKTIENYKHRRYG